MSNYSVSNRSFIWCFLVLLALSLCQHIDCNYQTCLVEISPSSSFRWLNTRICGREWKCSRLLSSSATYFLPANRWMPVLKVKLANRHGWFLIAVDLVCNGPLGMTSGEIRDWQITASSTLWDPDCHEKNARLYQPSDRAWCARHKSDSEWLQIDLGIAAKVSRRWSLRMVMTRQLFL